MKYKSNLLAIFLGLNLLSSFNAQAVDWKKNAMIASPAILGTIFGLYKYQSFDRNEELARLAHGNNPGRINTVNLSGTINAVYAQRDINENINTLKSLAIVVFGAQLVQLDFI